MNTVQALDFAVLVLHSAESRHPQAREAREIITTLRELIAERDKGREQRRRYKASLINCSRCRLPIGMWGYQQETDGSLVHHWCWYRNRGMHTEAENALAEVELETRRER